jgi:hypothetical protein
MRRHKRRRIAKDCERPANLLFWERDGCCRSYEARVAADVRVSIGLTNSKRALGFEVTNRNKEIIDFVLDRDQVAELDAFIRFSALGRLRKPVGREKNQVSLVFLNNPRRRLQLALETAAIRAHPGWHDTGDGNYELDDGAPEGARLVAWYKKTYPKEGRTR